MISGLSILLACVKLKRKTPPRIFDLILYSYPARCSIYACGDHPFPALCSIDFDHAVHGARSLTELHGLVILVALILILIPYSFIIMTAFPPSLQPTIVADMFIVFLMTSINLCLALVFTNTLLRPFVCRCFFLFGGHVR